MINWEGLNYSISNAARDFNSLTVESDMISPIKPIAQLEEVREKLIAARNRIFEDENLDGANKLGYQFDLLFGLEVYEILGSEIGFNNRVASSDDVWRYLSVNVIPDVVHARWGMNDDHFYKNSRRVWLKTIWWYIHLAWTGNKNETYELLKDNTTDTILQLVERPGIGYYTDMYREIMLQYKSYDDSDRNLFRSVLKLNTARLPVVSPELYDGGIKGYVQDLFNEVQDAI